MNKFVLILSFTLLPFSFQVNASTLAWDKITGYGPSLGVLQTVQGSPQELFGTISGLRIETNVLDDWTFILSDPSEVIIIVNSLETNGGSLLYDVKLDDNSISKNSGMNEAWSFNDELTAGNHKITVLGIATYFASSSGYEVGVIVPNSVVPIPAVGWLVGLSLIFGIFRSSKMRSLNF